MLRRWFDRSSYLYFSADTVAIIALNIHTVCSDFDSIDLLISISLLILSLYLHWIYIRLLPTYILYVRQVRIWSWDNPEHILRLEINVFAGEVYDLDWDMESKKIVAVGDGSERVRYNTYPVYICCFIYFRLIIKLFWSNFVLIWS